jgi:hypothetical protein
LLRVGGDRLFQVAFDPHFFGVAHQSAVPGVGPEEMALVKVDPNASLFNHTLIGALNQKGQLNKK